MKKILDEEKMKLVDVLNQEIYIDGKLQYVNNAIKIYTKSVFDALNEDDSSLISTNEFVYNFFSFQHHFFWG